ncbi:MAG TPA: GxxExxY protein [Anaerolineales bacterium]|nr:GxxExxY protein [Anaerolineales bacterium]
MLHEEITSDIINAFYKVYNTLGYGFLEKVYENALAQELSTRGHEVKQQVPIQVLYERKVVGEYYADLLVDDKVILELKTAESIAKEHEAQLLNYLKAVRIEVGLLLNFGKEPQFKRKIFTNQKEIRKNPRKSVSSE